MSPIKKSTMIILIGIVLVAGTASIYYYYSNLLWQREHTLTVGYLYTFSHIVGLTMKDRGVLEEYLPGWKVEYQRFTSGVQLRESMIAGTVDIGFIGASPFLTGLEKDVKWKIAMATTHCTTPHMYTLVTSNDDVQTLGDLKGKKVNLLGPSTMTHIMMAMITELWPEADLTMEDIDAVWVKHSDALSLILTHDIDAAFFVAPYNYRAIDAGCRELVDCGEVGERLGFNLSMTHVAVMEKFHDEHLDAYKKFVQAYNETIYWIQTHENETINITVEGGYFENVEEELIRICLHNLIQRFDPVPHHVIDIWNEWMFDNGYISKVFTKDEVFYDDAIVMGAS